MKNKKSHLLLSLVLIFCCSFNSVAQNQLKISLAEWSLHKAIQSGKITNLDFPRMARMEYGIEAIEYVSTFFDFKSALNDSAYLQKLKTECERYRVISNLIMVDGEGNLGDTCIAKRNRAIENHYKWVKAARFLGCHTIRVNASGEGSPEAVQIAVIDGLTKLCNYAQQFNINVIVENHWGNSSQPDWLIPAINAVHKSNCGVLPDFGNFDKIDRYNAVEKMMPYARGVSAKSYDFDKNGNETKINYQTMMQIVLKSGYKGYIGIEYEGEKLSEAEGIKATMQLIKKCLAE